MASLIASSHYPSFAPLPARAFAGDIDHPGSYSYDVFYRVVPGLTFEMCQAGKMTPEVESEFVEKIKELEALGVSGITGDCGFMMWFQALARQHTHKPVFMSALAHLPAIACAFAPHEQIGTGLLLPIDYRLAYRCVCFCFYSAAHLPVIPRRLPGA